MKYFMRLVSVVSLAIFLFLSSIFYVSASPDPIVLPETFKVKPSIMYSTTDSQSNDQDSEALSE